MAERCTASMTTGSLARSHPLLPDHVPRGIALALTAAALFTFMDSCVKLLSERYPTLEIVAINASLAAAVAAALALGRAGITALRTTRPYWHLCRGLGMLVGAS